MVDALIDTGAERSVLAKHVYEAIPVERRPPIHPAPGIFTGIGGTQECLGVCHLTIPLKDHTISSYFYVLELPNIDCLIGMDILRAENIASTSHEANYNLTTAPHCN